MHPPEPQTPLKYIIFLYRHLVSGYVKKSARATADNENKITLTRNSCLQKTKHTQDIRMKLKEPGIN
jgi:hypothetical protein